MVKKGKPNPPPNGYILPRWDNTHAYRSTATAYIKRENVTRVKNENGHTYSLKELENAIIGHKN